MTAEDEAACFVLGEPRERVEELIALLGDGSVAPSMARVRVQRRIRLGSGSLDRTMKLLSCWDGGDDPGGRLARTLRSQLRVADDVRNRGVRAELVWTGQKPSGSPLRNTVPVVNEMLDAAESSVLVLAYSIWLGQPTAGSVLKRLVQCVERGASVTFVVDRRYRTKSGPPHHNLVELRKRWPGSAPKPSVHSWGDDEDEIAKLHAKVLVVDRRDLLVTSANLTGHGMEGNLELGTRTVGKPAERAHDHVVDLIASGFFQPEKLW